MATRRRDLIDSENAGYYHLITRCVRRAYLCGIDPESGQNFEHRKDWLEARFYQMAEIFSIEVYAYAVMSNHYHLVVYVDPLAPRKLSDEEVAERWVNLYPGKLNHPNQKLQRQLKLQSILNDSKKLADCRKRLGNISELMKCINEPLAKRSNKEDDCKGAFVESRFNSQALLDEAAVQTCMAYVDLNPIRAGITDKLEESQHTSIKRRLDNLTQEQLCGVVTALAGKVRERTMAMPLKDYIGLVEWTGKAIVYPEKAKIPANMANIFDRLNIRQEQWLSNVSRFGSQYSRAAGSLEKLKSLALKLNQSWIKGIKASESFYLSTG